MTSKTRYTVFWRRSLHVYIQRAWFTSDEARSIETLIKDGIEAGWLMDGRVLPDETTAHRHYGDIRRLIDPPGAIGEQMDGTLAIQRKA